MPIQFSLPIEPIKYERTEKSGGRFGLLLSGLLLFAIVTVGAPHTARAQSVTTTVHIVAPGETLSEIAKTYGVSAEDIQSFNGIEDPNTIVEGQPLLIPGTPEQAPAPSGMHRIQAGETLSAIAKQFAMTSEELMALNGIADPDAIYSGQLLIVVPSAVTPFVEVATTETATPTPESPTPAQMPTTVPDVHTVQPGETLSGIARQYGLDLATLLERNRIEDADTVVVGLSLRLAPITAETEPDALTAGDAEGEVTLPAEYTVQAGESLSGIARQFGLSLDELMTLNDIADADSIYAGQTLRLPGVSGPEIEEQTVVETADSTLPDAVESVTTPIPYQPPPEPLERSGNPSASLNPQYTIRPGDTLGLIALRTGVDADALRHLNGFSSLNDPLSAGKTLLLPATGDELRPQSPAEEYVVQPGESLGQIAQRYGLTLGDLLAANRIADPNAVYTGQRLVIPPRSAGSTSAHPEDQVGPARSGYFYYTVRPGDTISALAKQFNSTMSAIREYNSLPDNDSIYAGLEIRIPYGAPPIALRQPPVPLSGSRFVVSISRQQCWLYQGETLRYSWSCSTGAGDRKTKAGNYAVQSKIANAKSNAYRLDMPYWLGIYDVGPYENGIHGLPVNWKTGQKIWEGLIGQPATFGCAMLDDVDAATLFRQAFLGMPVHVVN